MDEPTKEAIPTYEIPRVLDYASPQKEPLQSSMFPTRPTMGSQIATICIVIVILLILIAMLLPALGRSGGVPAYRTQCGANLHQILSALIMDAQNNGGRFPNSFESAILHGTMNPQVWAKLLICPQSHDTPASGTTAQQIAANLHALGRPEQFLNSKNPPSLHVSYVYLGKNLTVGSSRKVLIFEPPEHHVIGKESDINVAWTDGSIRTYTLSPTMAQQLMAEFQVGQNPPATLKKMEGLK